MVINPKHLEEVKKATMKVGTRTVSVYDRIQELLKDMQSASPKFDPFTGPIRDRNGVLRVPLNQKMSVADLNNMQWVAPGVTGQVADEPK